tara:strand:+ start:41 stop:220 length:180 start_codon:yes stop_codon:yes gene_type:complete
MKNFKIIKELQSIANDLNDTKDGILNINDDGSGDVSEYTNHCLSSDIIRIYELINNLNK